MTISEALAILDRCRRLNLSQRSVTATEWKSDHELGMLTHEQLREVNVLYRAHVHVRRSKRETFEAMLLRAATLVQAGHLPPPSPSKVKPWTSDDRCACGERSDLVWNYQLQQRLCRRCDRQWHLAAASNDLPPAKGIPQ